MRPPEPAGHDVSGRQRECAAPDRILLRPSVKYVAACTPFVTPPLRPPAQAKKSRVFWIFLSKKNNKKKAFFLKKEAKTFVCLGRSKQANAR
jgi:hypothetical protein